MFKYEVGTNVGVVRNENQDRADVFENKIAVLAILCDGMGGHFGGLLASSIAVETFGKQFVTHFPESIENINNWFKDTINLSVSLMKKEAKCDKKKMDMGTTVTAAVYMKDTKDVYVYNIGDSRTYIYNGYLHQISRDQNLMNYYIDQKELHPYQASRVPSAASLISSLGPKKKTNIATYLVEAESQTKTIVLTSDGVHDYISKPLFEQTIANNNKSLKEKTNFLIDEAIHENSTDNLTIIILEVK